MATTKEQLVTAFGTLKTTIEEENIQQKVETFLDFFTNYKPTVFMTSTTNLIKAKRASPTILLPVALPLIPIRYGGLSTLFA